MTISKIEQAKQLLDKKLDFISPFILDDCINLIKSYYLSALIYKKEINQDDIDLINSISCCVTRVYEKNIQELFSKLYNISRENSKGACIIKKFLMQKDLYDKYFNPNDGKISFLGAEIVPVMLDLNDHIIGLCESKFKYIEPKYMIILGKVTNNAK